MNDEFLARSRPSNAEIFVSKRLGIKYIEDIDESSVSPYGMFVKVDNVENQPAIDFVSRISKFANGQRENPVAVKLNDDHAEFLILTAEKPGNPDFLVQDLREKYGDSILCEPLNADDLFNLRDEIKSQTFIAPDDGPQHD